MVLYQNIIPNLVFPHPDHIFSVQKKTTYYTSNKHILHGDKKS